MSIGKTSDYPVSTICAKEKPTYTKQMDETHPYKHDCISIGKIWHYLVSVIWTKEKPIYTKQVDETHPLINMNTWALVRFEITLYQSFEQRKS